MIELNNLYKEFPVPSGTEVAVDSITLSIGDDEFFTFVGPSGCGKSTTLRCVAGLEKPTSGSIVVNGVNVTDAPANERNIAMMFQNIALYPHMTIEENIAYPLKVRKVPKGERHEKVVECAQMMQVATEMFDKYPGELSGGQRQRVALARTVIQDPALFLMDEPLSDLDAKLQAEIRKVIQRVHLEVTKPMIYVTHDQEEAMSMSDRIAVMKDGKIEQIGEPEDLYHYPTNRFVGEFIGNPTMNVLTGELVSLDGDQVVVSIYGHKLEIPLEFHSELERLSEVLVGIRPNAISIGSDMANADIVGTVQLIEPLGDRYFVSLSGPEGEIRSTISSKHESLEIGEEVPLLFNSENVYLIDPETEAILAKGRESAANLVT